MKLSAFADLESAIWDVSIDGRWLGEGPGDHPVVEFTDFDAAGYGSARLLALWLADGENVQFSALRPANAKGQDKDEIAVVLPASEAANQAFDPRLSTEYSDAGVPRRFGIELWLGQDPEGDQHPLRLFGEAAGDPLRDGPVSVYPMRAHRGDVDGLALYLYVH